MLGRNALLVGLLAVSLPACSLLSPEDTSSDSAALTPSQRVVSGDTLASSFVDRDKQYVAVRSISELARLGGLSGPLLDVARRIDGAVATGPADDLLTIDELVRTEQPDALAALFPHERELLPKLWSLFELADGWIGFAAPAQDLTTQIKEEFKAPVLDEASSMPIASLPAELQSVALRIELLMDTDHNSATISTDDVDAAIARPGSFLPSEVEAFKPIRAATRAQSISVLPVSMYNLIVPKPFEKVLPVVSLGQATFSATESFRVIETRRPEPGVSGNSHINATHALDVKLTVPAAMTLHIVNLTEPREQDTTVAPLGDSYAELWMNGARVAHRRLKIADFRRVFLRSGHADPRGEGDTKLNRNESATSPEDTAVFETTAGPKGFRRNVPTVVLRPGTYSVPNAPTAAPDAPTVALEVYQGNIVFVRAGAVRTRLGATDAGSFIGGSKECSYELNAQTSALSGCGLAATSINESMLR